MKKDEIPAMTLKDLYLFSFILQSGIVATILYILRRLIAARNRPNLLVVPF